MATDPVCSMQVDEADAEFKTEYDGKTYYFCSESWFDRGHHKRGRKALDFVINGLASTLSIDRLWLRP